jgi:hypothetical protein
MYFLINTSDLKTTGFELFNTVEIATCKFKSFTLYIFGFSSFEF